MKSATSRCSIKDVPQEITVFEHQTTQPLSVTLLIDTSGSTAKDLKYETVSLTRFLNALVKEGNPNDAASLYSFNDEVTLLNSFTRRLGRLEESLRPLKADAGTSLYDAIYLSSSALRDRDGRHVIVVVTDGGDTTSTKRYADALASAQKADAVFYPIVVVPITNPAGRNLGGEHALETLAQSTGGRSFYPTVNELDRTFADILRELRTQYLIGYYPRAAPRRATANTTEFAWKFRSARICTSQRALATMELSPVRVNSPWQEKSVKSKHPITPSKRCSTCSA